MCVPGMCSLADLSHTGDRLGACGYLNASVCHPTVEMSRAGHNILVAVYNPLAWPRSEGVRVPVNTSFSANWTVTGARFSYVFNIPDTLVCLEKRHLTLETYVLQHHLNLVQNWSVWAFVLLESWHARCSYAFWS